MSILGDFFSPSQDTTQQTTQNSSSTSSNTGNTNSQSNLWNQLQPYFSGTASTLYNPTQPNQYQLGAANNQAGATGNLTPGFGAASSITSGGLSPTAYQPYMSQYTQSVIDPTVNEFQRLNAATTSDINGNLARSGALGNSNNNQTRANALAPIVNICTEFMSKMSGEATTGTTGYDSGFGRTF